METLRFFSVPTLQIPSNVDKTKSKKVTFSRYKITLTSSFSLVERHKPFFKAFTTISTSNITTDETENTSAPKDETQTQDEKFDWYAHWYPLMPVCDLDKRKPHAKKVLVIDVVIWWDRNESTWKVFDDACPLRLAPLSEGRIDQWGRLQCVYHGWCFNGSGDCKFIPQAPADGPLIHTSKKACVGAYPTVQNGLVWFWPSCDPQYKDILTEKKPPYIPEIDDPSYTCSMANREIPYGEGGRPIDLYIPKLDINGFTTEEQNSGQNKFVPPCISYTSLLGPAGKSYGSLKPPDTEMIPVPPTSGCFPSLKIFHVTVLYPYNEDLGNLLSYLPVVENLSIHGKIPYDYNLGSNIDLKVSAPELKTLKLIMEGEEREQSGTYDGETLNQNHIRVEAPKLQNLDLVQIPLSNYTLENSKSVVNASIAFKSLAEEEWHSFAMSIKSCITTTSCKLDEVMLEKGFEHNYNPFFF